MFKVSVIVPVYNMEKYLEKCLDSLLGQTLEEIEIIVIDDGSKDSSPEILKRYSEIYGKLKYFTKENGGLSDARNCGLIHAAGEYIGYLDSDDFADPDMYEVMYDKAKENGSDIVECNIHHTYEDYEDTEIMEKFYEAGELLCRGRYIVWNKIYRREWLISTGVTFPFGLIYEDVAFFLKIAPYIKKYDYVDIAPVHYVQRKSSINNASSERTMHIFYILRDIISFYKEKGFYGRYEKELEYFYARILLCSSFARMCLIPNRLIRKRALKLNFRELAETFPEWRKNGILRKEKGRNARFMKMQILPVYKLCSMLLPAVFKLKEQRKAKI